MLRKIDVAQSQFILAALILILASWLRFAGTAHSLSPNGAYALLFIGQVTTTTVAPTQGHTLLTKPCLVPGRLEPTFLSSPRSEVL